MTLQSQYNQFLKHNPDSTFSFNEWMKWHSHQMEQAIIQMMQDDEELGLYDYDWCKGKVVLPREEIKLEDVFNDDKKENIKKFIHEVKSIPTEEILANRCNAYEFIDFDKQETLEEAAERNYNEQKLNTYTPYNFKDAFIEGAKWQQERSYSEEDLKEAFNKGFYTAYGCKSEWIERIEMFFKQWFEQFKKK